MVSTVATRSRPGHAPSPRRPDQPDATRGRWAGERVRVNCLAPGPIDTPMVSGRFTPEVLGKLRDSVPLGMIGPARHVAHAIGYLVSPEAAFVTGTVMNLRWPGARLMAGPSGAATRRKATAAAATTGVRAIPVAALSPESTSRCTWVRGSTYRPGDQIPTSPSSTACSTSRGSRSRKAIGPGARGAGWCASRTRYVRYTAPGSSARPAASLDLGEARSQVADLAAATEVRGVTMARVAARRRGARRARPSGRRAKVHGRRTCACCAACRSAITTFIAARSGGAGQPTGTPQPMFELLGKARHQGRAGRPADRRRWRASRRRARSVEVVGAPLLRLTRVVFVASRPVERVVALLSSARRLPVPRTTASGSARA